MVYALAFLITGLTAEGKTNSSFATFSASDGPHLVYVDVNQHINQAAYNGAAWYNQDLTELANSGRLAALGTSLTVYLASDGPRIYYVDTNQHLNELGYHTSTWLNFDVTVLANTAILAAPETGLATYLASDGPRIYYVDSSQHVNEMGYHGSAWANFDLANLSGSSVLAAPDTGITTYLASDGPRVYYVDTNRHLNEMGYHTSEWANYDVTALAGSAELAGPSTGITSCLASDGPRIYYEDANQHIDEIGYHGSNGWANFDITALANAGVLAGPGTGLVTYLADDGPRIYYIDTDQHVNEIGYHTSTWANYDVKILSGSGALAVADMGAADYLASDGPRVYYVDASQHLNEMGYHGSNGWANFDVTLLSGGPLVEIFYTIGGQVQAGGSGFSGVTVAVNGTTSAGTSISRTAATDANGNYLFSVPVGGSYTVTPSAGDYTFDAPSASFSNLSGNQTANFTGYINGASTNPSTPDPSPAPYPNYLSSVPTSSGTPDCGNLSGTWTESSSFSPSTWSLTQNGNLVAGTMTNTDSSCGQTIVWQVTGSTNGGSQYSLSRGNPNPSMACGDVVDSANVSLTVNSCTSGVASNTLIAPQGYYFASTGTNTEPGENTTWSRSAAPTYSLASSSQMPIPSLPNNAQMIPISITDNPQLTTTASVSGYSFKVNYSAQFLGNPHSSCQASQVTLSIPSASGTSSASSNISATSGCGGVFTVSGLIGQASTQNALYVVAPPDILVRELWGEANRQASVGDQVSELAIGNAIRQRFGDKQYFATFNYYEDMNVGRYNQGFDGLNRCPSGCLSGIATQHSTETLNAAYIYGGINTPATNVENSKCFVSPDSYDWQLISAALQSQTTVTPGPLHFTPRCWYTKNRQFVYKASVGRNAGYSGSIPAFVFVQWRDPSWPAVIQIP